MKITFLGTSHAVPSKERCCQSILIEIGEKAYLADAGAPVTDLLTRMDFDLTRISGVFLTHMHGDHIHGLPQLMDLACWFYRDMDFDVYMTEKDRCESICSLLAFYPCERVRTHIYEAGLIYEKDSLRVTAFPTTHLEREGRPAYGFLMETSENSVYISGDLDGEKIDLPDFLKEDAVDLLIVECAHFCAEELIDKLKNCKAKRVAVIHTFPPEKYEILEAARNSLPCELLLPKDGDVLELVP